MESALTVAQEIAARVIGIDGVVAVVLGGSRSVGTAHATSDIDIGLYYDPQRPMDLPALGRLAAEVDDRHESGLLTQPGEWGPWINGGGWLVVGGVHVDWLYRDLARVEQVIDSCRAGLPITDYQVGHPHAFHSHIYMGEIHYCRVLQDPTGAIPKLKLLTTPYPALLKQRLVQRFLFEARFSLEVARKGAARDDVAYVCGCLYRSIACLVQVLFAWNERYILNEKGSVAAIAGLRLRPDGFAAAVDSLLSTPGAGIVDLQASINRGFDLVGAVQVCVQAETK